MKAINPFTGELVREYVEPAAQDVAKLIEQSEDTYRDWKNWTFEARSQLMSKLPALLRNRQEELARLMAVEMGKVVREGRAEIEKCAWACDFYSKNAERFLQSEPVETDASKSYVAFRPLGIVLAIMPWNFPFWQVFRFAAPALMAGNVGVLKHASNVPGCALAIEELFLDAGFPEGAFRTLLIGSEQVAALIENPRVRAVTLTGSTPAGRAVAAKAGEMLKKTVLELGGSDPYLILADADPAAAAAVCAAGRLLNSGQSCIAAKRFIVVPEVRDQFEQLLVEQMAASVLGDPLDEGVTMGPLARRDLRDELHEQVSESVRRGARCLLGGEIQPGAGALYPATVLTEVQPGMPAYGEELFGPVAAVIPVADEAEALRVANDSLFGLGAAVLTSDLARGEEIALHHLEAGSCFVNTFVKSDPRLPFGGIKESGYGRELSHYGIREFVNIKTIYIK